MSKRFGRNQRRRLLERAESADRVLFAVRSSYHVLVQENANLQARLRRSIEIDCNVFKDQSRENYEARMEAHKLGHEGLYVARRIDEREVAMQRDKMAFIEHCSNEMAKSICRAIGEKWK